MKNLTFIPRLKSIMLVLIFSMSITSLLAQISFNGGSKNIYKNIAGGANVFPNVGTGSSSVVYTVENALSTNSAHTLFEIATTSTTGIINVRRKSTGNLTYGTTYKLVVKATDGGSSDTANFNITVLPNQAPTFSVITAAINENQPANSYVSSGGTNIFFANDVDGAITAISYSIVGGAAASSFTLENLTGANDGKFRLKTNAPLNFESASSLALTIRATDGDSKSGDTTFTVTVNNINEAPILSGFTTASVAESASNNSNVVTVQMNDPDNATNSSAQTHTYSILTQVGGANSSPFKIVDSTGVIQVNDNNGIDYEGLAASDDTIEVTVRVIDSGSPVLSDTAVVKIRVTDVPESVTFQQLPTGLSIASYNSCNALQLYIPTGTLHSYSNQLNPRVSGVWATNKTVGIGYKRLEKGINDTVWTATPGNFYGPWYTRTTTYWIFGTFYDDRSYAEVVDYNVNPDVEYAYRYFAYNTNNHNDIYYLTNNYVRGYFAGSPNEPTITSVSTGNALGNECTAVEINWTYNGQPPTHFDLFREEKTGDTYGPKVLFATPTGTLRSHTDNTMVPGKVYRYTIRAVNINNSSSCYFSDNVGTLDGYSLKNPEMATNFALTLSPTCNVLTGDWELDPTSQTPVDSTFIVKKVGSAWQRVAYVAPITTTTPVSNNPNRGATETYRVETKNVCGTTQTADNSISIPEISPTVTSFVDSTKTDPSSGAAYLKFAFTPDSSKVNDDHYLFKNSVLLQTIPAGVTSYDETDVPSCQFATYTIATSNSCGYGARDSIFTAVIPVIQLPANSVLADDGEHPDKTIIRWTDTQNETGFRVYRDNAVISVENQDVVNYVDENGTPGVIYNYSVEAVTSCSVSNREQDLGFSDPNGVISGHISTPGGQYVKDVEVVVSPTVGTSIKLNGAPAASGNSITLNGSTQYLTANSVSVSTQNGITLEGWFKFSQSKQAVFMLSNASGKILEINTKNNTPNFEFIKYDCPGGSCATSAVTTSNLISYNNWQHFSFVFNPNSTIEVYVNGVKSQTLNFSTFNTWASTATTFQLGFNGAATYMNGIADDIRVWETARTNSDILGDYSSELDGTENNLGLYFTLNNYNSTLGNYNDNVIGSSTILSVTGGPNTGSANAPIQPISGGSRIDVGVIPSDKLADHTFTLSGWIKGNPGQIQNKILFGSTGIDLTFYLGKGQANTANIYSSVSNTWLHGTKLINDAKWHKITYTYNRTTQLMKLYIDDEFQGEANAGVIDLSNWNFIIGSGANGQQPFNGFIDEVQLWNYEVDSTTLVTEYNYGRSGEEDGLVAYWKMDESSNNKTFDRTSNNLHGTLYNQGTLTVWATTQIAPVLNIGKTDANGNYEIRAINYGGSVNGSSFTVTPALEADGMVHTFSPSNKSRVLSFTTVQHDGVDFTDISVHPIAGYVKYYNAANYSAACFEQNVVFTLDGAYLNPPPKTNASGVFSLESPLGIHYIKPDDQYDYVKFPKLVNGEIEYLDSLYLDVNKPYANLKWESFDLYTLSGTITGGKCNLPLGPLKVKLVADNGCFNETINAQADGSYSFDSIPPLNYTLTVIPNNKTIKFDGESISISSDTIVNLNYRGALNTEVTFEPIANKVFQSGCNDWVMVSNTPQVQAKIYAYELYPGNQRCYLEDYSVNIVNDIGDTVNSYIVESGGPRLNSTSNPQTYFILDTFKVGAPFLGGIGASQFRKKYEYLITDTLGRIKSNTELAVVTGTRKRPGTFVNGEITRLLDILRDPPGDQSYSYMEKDSTYCYNYYSLDEEYVTNEFELLIGGGVGFNAGWVAEASMEFRVQGGFRTIVEDGGGTETIREECYTLEERISTNDDEQEPGKRSDLFIGNTTSYTFALTDIVTYNTTTCNVSVSQSVSKSNQGIVSFFNYNRAHIEDVLIPDLNRLIGIYSDSLTYATSIGNNTLKAKYTAEVASLNTSKSSWQGVLNSLDQLDNTINLGSLTQLDQVLAHNPGNAVINGQNVAFAGGTNYESSYNYSYSNNVNNTDHYMHNVGFRFHTDVLNGVALTIDWFIGKIFNDYNYTGTTVSKNNTYGYVLSDNDIGDRFLVQVGYLGASNTVLSQRLYGPNFKLIAGASSCPAEPNTAHRENVVLTMETSIMAGMKPTEKGYSKLFVTNLSDTEDGGRFTVNANHASNPDGAELKINGVPLANGLELIVPGKIGNNTIASMLTVERGPAAYTYENLQLVAYPTCEMEIYGSSLKAGISDTLSFTAYFNAPCADLEILSPDPTLEWTISDDDGNFANDTLFVFVQGYDTAATSGFSGLKLQVAAENGAWVNADNVNANAIIAYHQNNPLEPLYYALKWPISETKADGVYKYRVIAECGADRSYSNDQYGRLSRNAPVVFGAPMPSDGLLDPGDEISVTFNEDIDCSMLNVESVTLKGILSGLEYQSKAVSFDGVDDYGMIPNKSVYNFGLYGDFTVEFWIKTGMNSMNRPVIVGKKDWNNARNKGWAFVMNQGNRWRFNLGDGIDKVEVDGGLIGDNQWHHLAASVDRDGNVVLFQDGVQVGAAAANSIDNIDNLFGISIAQDGTANYSDFFIGKIDELRIWNFPKTQLNVLQGMNRTYTFDETGIVGLWRFDNSSGTTFADLAITKNHGALFNNPSWSVNDAAPLSMENVESLVDISYNCAQSKIIIIPNTPMKYLENANLTSTVYDARDLHNNIIVAPVEWDFYVNQNPVKWEFANIEKTKADGDVLTFVVNLKNEGGNNELFTLTDIPAWLQAQPMSGVIPPGYNQPITFTVSEYVNPGSYQKLVTAVTENGWEKLDVTVNNLCPAPVWTVNPAQFSNSMNLTCALVIEGDTAENKFNRIAAFSGDELRGVANLELLTNGTYRAFLTVYGDSSADAISFRAWDADKCLEYVYLTSLLDTVDTLIQFYADSIVGNITYPLIITTDGFIAQEIELNEGWTWISTNVNPDDSSFLATPINTVLGSLTPTDGDYIFSQTGSAQFYPSNNIWSGMVDSISHKELYKVFMNEADTLRFIGKPVDPLTTNIMVQTGWNWLGYYINQNMPISDAFASINANLQTGDIIKSQEGYAEYIAGDGWYGSLKYLEPGKGYMLKSSNPAILSYPSAVANKNLVPQNLEPILWNNQLREIALDNQWQFKPNYYPQSAQITGEVYYTNNISLGGTNNIVAAYYEGECRGMAKVEQVKGRNLYFLTVYLKGNETEPFEFVVYNVNNGKVEQIVETYNFNSNQKLGSIHIPAPLHLDYGMNEDLQSSLFAGYFIQPNQPNPFNNSTRVTYGLGADDNVLIQVMDVQGRVVDVLQNGTQAQGMYTLEWNPNSSLYRVLPGMYFIRISTNNYTETIKAIYLTNGQ